MTASYGVSVYVAVHSYGLNGKGPQALELYCRMPPAFVNEITHICVLNACSHAGLLAEARPIFNKIAAKTVKIYTAMVDELITYHYSEEFLVLSQIDCLSRGGAFDGAQQLIHEYEIRHPPSLPMNSACPSYAEGDEERRRTLMFV